MPTSTDCIQNAVDELRQWREKNPQAAEPHDAIFEIADRNTPIYTSDLLRMAAEYLPLATGEPELGPAFDGRPTPVNIIAANVFAYLEQKLWDTWQTIVQHEKENKE